jgi:HUS1 checkpoint protein
VLESAAEGNVINLELPLGPFQRALKSALSSSASTVNLRLSKRDKAAILCLTITSSSMGTQGAGFDDADFGTSNVRETVITQEIPVRVLLPRSVEGIHEPSCPDPEVNIFLPPLIQLKAISERFNRLAVVNASSLSANSSAGAKLHLAANMHGSLKLSLQTDLLNISSVWEGLEHPDLDPTSVEGGKEGLARHPTEVMRRKYGEESWASVRIDGKDWSRVLNVGRLAKKVIACRSIYPLVFLQLTFSRFLSRTCFNSLRLSFSFGI